MVPTRHLYAKPRATMSWHDTEGWACFKRIHAMVGKVDEPVRAISVEWRGAPGGARRLQRRCARLAELAGRSDAAVCRRLCALGLCASAQRSPHHPVTQRDGEPTPGERAVLEREFADATPRGRLAILRRLEYPLTTPIVADGTQFAIDSLSSQSESFGRRDHGLKTISTRIPTTSVPEM